MLIYNLIFGVKYKFLVFISSKTYIENINYSREHFVHLSKPFKKHATQSTLEHRQSQIQSCLLLAPCSPRQPILLHTKRSDSEVKGRTHLSSPSQTKLPTAYPAANELSLARKPDLYKLASASIKAAGRAAAAACGAYTSLRRVPLNEKTSERAFRGG